ncbi:MAG: tRNA uridine-5-carboxymethylaminomethyl(34) synthesis GTPase MnmE [Gammaproteobacteria bacterium]|nr:tRNA uridine-5-carboxymethylaminomethyl(34) synthesis GTPase MnmE [Gammaproteobacteria bacterium]|tara:strand:- start:118690 stop:120072 length:1383 start_codon:yes stop_codon:yes gene_type:complete
MSQSAPVNPDTICAIATPKGIGGVGIIRISGSLVKSIAESITGSLPPPRYAQFCSFRNNEGEVIDQGICLFFPGPASFTGEDILELQAHGGPVILDRLQQAALDSGARLARPGEFSERAFLNNKIDLTQAEAIADLIESHTLEASRYALRSLQGEFSRLINQLLAAIIELRVFVEAAIDFPEEEIDFLQSGEVKQKLSALQKKLSEILQQAKSGRVLREGLSIVIIGEPNVGKSSLLNLLSGQSSAIVTDIAGTTRDTLRELINLDGLPVHVVDTAGLRESEDLVEQEGIKRAWHEISQADHILLLVDASLQQDIKSAVFWPQLKSTLELEAKVTLLRNKIDLCDEQPRSYFDESLGLHCIQLSALQKNGFDLLTEHLKKVAGITNKEEGGFIARRRHLDALQRAELSLLTAYTQLTQHNAGELLAEDLREAQQALSEITGEFSTDDLLGEIFSSFCIGK